LRANHSGFSRLTQLFGEEKVASWFNVEFEASATVFSANAGKEANRPDWRLFGLNFRVSQRPFRI
jgi:hypothetical protein